MHYIIGSCNWDGIRLVDLLLVINYALLSGNYIVILESQLSSWTIVYLGSYVLGYIWLSQYLNYVNCLLMGWWLAIHLYWWCQCIARNAKTFVDPLEDEFTNEESDSLMTWCLWLIDNSIIVSDLRLCIDSLFISAV